MNDRWNRKINYLRISVTDDCNLRCCYCSPNGEIEHLKEEELLTFKEIKTIVAACIRMGIDTVKITGGEPLLRKNITSLIADLKNMEGIHQVTLTTNGVLLARYAKELKNAGIDSINVNLPALSREKYRIVTRRDQFQTVMEGIETALAAGIRLKINCVARQALTDRDLKEYGLLAKDKGIDVRFIEMMPIGYGKQFSVYSNDAILKRIEDEFGISEKTIQNAGNGPAVYYQFAGFIGKIGFISAISHNFCSQCNRIRLTADGYLKLCLNYECGISLKEILRGGRAEELEEIIRQSVYEKPQKNCFDERKKELKQLEARNMFQIGG